MSIAFVAPSPIRAFTGSCTGPFRVQAQDAEGVAAAVVGAKVIGLYKDGGATASYYTSPDCLSGLVTEVSIGDGASDVDFYFKNSANESATVTADGAASGLGATSRFVSSASSFDDAWSGTMASGPARYEHSTVWTGTRMIIWGGSGPTGIVNSGFSYDPVANSWSGPISTTNAPTARRLHSAVWTGSRMIVWGGADGTFNYFGDGRVYDPSTDSWAEVPISTENAPTARGMHSAVWTGTEMVIFGGSSSYPNFPVGTGARYNPLTDSWAAGGITTSLERESHAAVWTGTEMIVWGGSGTDGSNSWGLTSGARYNPATNTWSAPLNTAGSVSGGAGQAAVWTGTEMIVWGGCVPSSYGCANINSGASYNPVTDSWSAISATDQPGLRSRGSAVWTGKEMLVWGGAFEYDPWDNGFVYVP